MTRAFSETQTPNHDGRGLATEVPTLAPLSPLGLAALTYSQEYGWPVFPCRERDKPPKIAKANGGNGCHDASTHPEAVATWWDRWPHANIGLATGGALGLLVVDVDGAEGEHALAGFGLMPPTVEARTARGRHLYFHAPPQALRTTTRVLGPQLDTRGAGGYVLAPPSVHPDGPDYAFSAGLGPTQIAVAPLPLGLVERLAPSAHSARGAATPTRARAYAERSDVRRFRAWLANVPIGLRDGQGRNVTAYRIAARGLETLNVATVRDVLGAWNHGNAEPLSDEALCRILASAMTHRKGRAA